MTKPSLETLMACQTMCSFGSSLLYEGPGHDRLLALAEANDLLREPPFCELADGAAVRMADVLRDALSDDASFEAFYHDLRQDYAFLFYMVSVSKASPFESVYRTDDATMFGPTTLDVRHAYERFGLKLAEETSQPDDHLGIELAFLAELFRRASESDGQMHENLEFARAFMHEHVLSFSSIYLEQMARVARTAFYRDAARIIDDSIVRVAAMLDAWCAEEI
ncbi:MAG: molecular chaperone TorD family protein [Slackia sp.]|nr:molecular chaperone TorD family protein [Slackia sp.]